MFDLVLVFLVKGRGDRRKQRIRTANYYLRNGQNKGDVTGLFLNALTIERRYLRTRLEETKTIIEFLIVSS